MRGSRTSRGAGRQAGQGRYPRVYRLNQVLREVLAEEIERLGDQGPSELLTVTGVTVEPDLRHATVWLSSLSAPARELLEEHRVELQGAVARQTTMKRTPRLSFEVDPAVVQGAAVEEALRRIRQTDAHQPDAREPGAREPEAHDPGPGRSGEQGS